MIADQLRNRSDRLIVKLQSVQDTPCQFLTDQCMSTEMIPTILIGGLHHRFSHIMKQHRKPENLVTFHIFQCPQCMLCHIIFMMRCILCHTFHCIPLRQNHLRQSQFVCITDSLRVRRYQKFHQLRLNPFRTDILQIRSKFADGIRCSRLDWEIQLCRKTYRTKNPQCVFRKTLLRISHTPDQMMVQILHSAKYIHQTHLVIIRHGIDRKISSSQILFQPVGKLYLLWMSAVLICTIDPVGRHLKAVLTEKNRNRSMLDPCINRPAEQLFYLFRLCRSRNIPVLWPSCKDRISHAAPHRKCLIPMKLQIIDYK